MWLFNYEKGYVRLPDQLDCTSKLGPTIPFKIKSEYLGLPLLKDVHVSVGWGANANVHGFGEQPTVKSQILNLVRSIRTVMRSE